MHTPGCIHLVLCSNTPQCTGYEHTYSSQGAHLKETLLKIERKVKILVSLFHVGIESGPLPLEGGGNVSDVVEVPVSVGLHKSVALQ